MTNEQLHEENAALRRTLAAALRSQEKLRKRHESIIGFLRALLKMDERDAQPAPAAPSIQEAMKAFD